MFSHEAQRLTIQTNVVQAFTNANIRFLEGFLSPLSLSIDKDRLISDWTAQWMPHRNKATKESLRKMWHWASLSEKDTENKTMAGWYSGPNLIALSNMKLCDSNDNSRFKAPSIAIFLFERAPGDNSFKGLTRPLFYETARQIALLKDIPSITVIGGYLATDQDDFDLFFEMESDVPHILPLKDCNYRMRKVSEPFDWKSLPTYFDMKRQRQLETTPPTPAI